jgi:hypothetical protein
LSDLFEFTAPVLASLTPGGVHRHHAALRREVRWIDAKLRSLPALERLTVLDRLHALRTQLGMRTAPTSLSCKLPTGPGLAGDPQVLATAIELGCTGHATVAPFTPVGWPSDMAVSNSLAASVDGVRVAASLGVVDQYRSELNAELTKTWLPATAADDPQLIDVALIANLLGANVELPAGSSGQKPSLDDGSLFGFVARQITAQAPASDPNIALSPVTGLRSAMEYQLLYVSTGNGRYHQQALTDIEPLRRDGGLFGGDDGSVPSFSATVLGSWISGAHLPATSLKAAGICTGPDTCSDDHVREPKLAVAGMSAALASPATDVFPMPV